MATNKRRAASRAHQAAQSQRGQMMARQAAEARSRKRNRLVIIIVTIVVVALALGGVVIWQLSNPPEDSATPPAGLTTTGTAAVVDETFVPPNGSDEGGWIEVRSANAKPDALVVDEHLDYQCPICGFVNEFYAEPLRALAERGDIVLRIHIRSFLDTNLHNDSSTRAARAATCADTVGSFLSYHDAVMVNQPDEGVGYTDQQLRVDFAQQAGITDANLTQFQQCYDTEQTLTYVEAMEWVNHTSRTINGADQDPPGGTPAFYVNGTQFKYTQLMQISPSNEFLGLAVNNTPDDLLAFLQQIAG